MNKEQRRYKIKKIEQYKEMITKEEKKENGLAFLLALNILSFGLCMYMATWKDVLHATLGPIGAFMNAYGAIVEAKGIKEAISKKTMLQGLIEQITNELQMPNSNENTENKGRIKR